MWRRRRRRECKRDIARCTKNDSETRRRERRDGDGREGRNGRREGSSEEMEVWDVREWIRDYSRADGGGETGHALEEDGRVKERDR